MTIVAQGFIYYSDCTMRYRQSTSMAGPIGSVTPAHVYRRAVNATSFEGTILRVIPFETASESQPVRLDGTVDLVPMNTSGRKSDKIELRFYPSWPTTTSTGKLIWESNC